MIRTLMTRRLAAAATGGVLAVGGGALAANTFISPAGAASPTPTASATASASTTPAKTFLAKHPRLKVARSVVHGEFTAKTKTGYQVFDAQRGTVTAVSPSAITVKSPDGYTTTYTVTSATAVHKGKTKTTISAVTVNAKAVVLAKPSGSTRTATQIVVPAK